METITIKANKKKSHIIKEFLDNQKVKYQTTSSKKVITEDSPYDPEFVEMILRSKQQAKEGKGRVIKIEDLWK